MHSDRPCTYAGKNIRYGDVSKPEGEENVETYDDRGTIPVTSDSPFTFGKIDIKGNIVRDSGNYK